MRFQCDECARTMRGVPKVSVTGRRLNGTLLFWTPENRISGKHSMISVQVATWASS